MGSYKGRPTVWSVNCVFPGHLRGIFPMVSLPYMSPNRAPWSFPRGGFPRGVAQVRSPIDCPPVGSPKVVSQEGYTRGSPKWGPPRQAPIVFSQIVPPLWSPGCSPGGAPHVAPQGGPRRGFPQRWFYKIFLTVGPHEGSLGWSPWRVPSGIPQAWFSIGYRRFRSPSGVLHGVPMVVPQGGSLSWFAPGGFPQAGPLWGSPIGPPGSPRRVFPRGSLKGFPHIWSPIGVSQVSHKFSPPGGFPRRGPGRGLSQGVSHRCGPPSSSPMWSPSGGTPTLVPQGGSPEGLPRRAPWVSPKGVPQGGSPKRGPPSAVSQGVSPRGAPPGSLPKGGPWCGVPQQGLYRRVSSGFHTWFPRGFSHGLTRRDPWVVPRVILPWVLSGVLPRGDLMLDRERWYL
jgi:hypothetical protein